MQWQKDLHCKKKCDPEEDPFVWKGLSLVLAYCRYKIKCIIDIILMSDEPASYKSKCVRIICDKKCLGPVIMSLSNIIQNPWVIFVKSNRLTANGWANTSNVRTHFLIFFFGVRGVLNLREIDSGHIFGNFTNMTIHLKNSYFSEERGQTIL